MKSIKVQLFGQGVPVEWATPPCTTAGSTSPWRILPRPGWWALQSWCPYSDHRLITFALELDGTPPTITSTPIIFNENKANCDVFETAFRNDWERSTVTLYSAKQLASALTGSVTHAADASMPRKAESNRTNVTWIDGQIIQLQHEIRRLEGRLSSHLPGSVRSEVLEKRNAIRRSYNKLKSERKQQAYSEHTTCKTAEDIWRISKINDASHAEPPCAALKFLSSFFPECTQSTSSNPGESSALPVSILS